MSSSYQIQPVQALLPFKPIYSENRIDRKHWHIIASYEFMLPQLTYSLKVTQFLLMFDMKIYISIEFVVIPMVQPSSMQIEQPKMQAIEEGPQSIEGLSQPLCIGSGIFELPACLRCFLGYSCNEHWLNN